jgi:Ca2+-binding EF-hand superfamily protein
MADVLNETQVAEYQDAFSALDTDHDGFIRSSQLGQILRAIGENPTDAEVQVYFILFPRDFQNQ